MIEVVMDDGDGDGHQIIMTEVGQVGVQESGWRVTFFLFLFLFFFFFE